MNFMIIVVQVEIQEQEYEGDNNGVEFGYDGEYDCVSIMFDI